MFSKFLLGLIHVDAAVKEILGRTPLDLIARHAVCDFGDISRRQLRANQISLADGGEIRSEYLADPTDPSSGRITVVTEDGWSDTYVAWTKSKPKAKEPAHGTDF